MIIYTTKEDDMLDWIAWKHYETVAVLEQLILANPDVTDERLPAGLKIKLPYIEAVAIKNGGVRLWN